MSRLNQIYVAKSEMESKKESQTNRKYYNNNNYYDDRRRSNKYQRRNYSNEKKNRIEYEPKQQSHQPQNKVYDAQSLIAVFREQIDPPNEIIELKKKIPQLFSNKPNKPQIFNHNHHHSDEEEPEWMKESDFDGNFELNDIDDEIETKRVQYQKDHGTYEKKQLEKQNNPIQNETKEQQYEKELEIKKYRERREQEQKQEEAADQTKVKLFQLFSIQQEQDINNQKISGKVLTVEEIEKQTFQQQKQLQIEEQTQQKEEKTQEKEIINEQISYDELEKLLGIKINNQSDKKEVNIPEEPQHNFEKIKTHPFSLQAEIHKKDLNEKLWRYIDKNNQIQGPFPTNHMDIWFQQQYFKSSLMICWIINDKKWIYFGQFLTNLELISQNKLDISQAMINETVDETKQQPQQSKQQQQYNPYNKQHYQQSSYNYNYNNYNNQNNGYSLQNNKNNNQYKNNKKPIFQIGSKEQRDQFIYTQSQQQESSTSGLILNKKDFPALDEHQ